MRALALIMMCVVLLAGIQASYLLVQARHQHQEEVDKHHDHSGPVAEAQTAARHTHKHHNKKEGELSIEGDDGSSMSEETDHHKKGKHQQENLDDPPLAPADPDKPFLDISIDRSFQTEQPRYEQIKPAQTEFIDAGDVMLHSAEKGESQEKENNTLEELEDKDHEDISLMDKDAPISIYEQMQGDSPLPDDSDRTDRKKKKKNMRKRKQNLKKKGAKTSVNMDKKDRKAAKKAEKKAKKEKKKAQKAKHSSCDADKDCNPGTCCVENRKGVKLCKRGGYKGVGMKCLDSCTCNEGLQCFISEMNKKGRRKKVKPGHRKLYGHCRNPKDSNLGKGHFMSAEETGIMDQ